MELGLVLGADYLPIHEIINLAPKIDEWGYAQISVPEIWGHDSISLLSILAHQTQQTRIATGIINIFSRTPGTVAMTAASIDEVSNGRFVLGLGLSGPKVIEQFHGIVYNKPLQRTQEYVEVLQTLFSNRRLNHQTNQLGYLRNFKVSIKQIRNIPIHIAALGPKNIKLTTEIADGWIPVIMPIPSFTSEVKTLKSIIPEEKKSRFSITPFVLGILGDGKHETDLLRGHLAYYIGGMGDFYNNMFKRLGFIQEADSIKKLWNRGKIKEAQAAVTDEILNLTCAYGSKEEIQEKIIDFINAGATCPLLTIPFNTDLTTAKATIEAMAPRDFLE
ncbi:MAG: LLM class flavin-dependent oxidoreductase [Candidatus Heimdallarchaeota archaeon]|nr:LLM class flavin-dependent oxidoreductase [Candidatus Heimdallarchaeota archaeon]